MGPEVVHVQPALRQRRWSWSVAHPLNYKVLLSMPSSALLEMPRFGRENLEKASHFTKHTKKLLYLPFVWC